MRYKQLPATFFKANRARLVAQLPERAIAVVNANDIMPTNADGTMGFRQNSDLYYLSGVDQEETILLLFPSARDEKLREILFVRETNELLSVWEGDKLSKKQATEVSGIEKVCWISEFPRVFGDLMFEAGTVFLNDNEHLRKSREVVTRERRFISQVRHDFPLHNLARLAPLLYRQRMTKSKEELSAIREATKFTDLGFRRLLKFVKPGVMEFEVEAELAHEYIRHGSKGFAYPPIIASGKNACVLHYVSNDQKCRAGDLLLLDVAAEYGNYNSDMTRTIPVSGKFTKRQREVYNAVLRILRACSEMLKPGVVHTEYQKEVDKLVEDELIGLGLMKKRQRAKDDDPDPPRKKWFMHGVSHHIGLDVHDVADPAQTIEAGMVLTVEPGIYIREEGFGVRLENIVVIGKNGNDDLMKNVPIEADEIEELMRR